MSVHRTMRRHHVGTDAMRPDRAEMDSTRTDSSAIGTAMSRPSVMPEVAMATVRHVSRATRARNSASSRSGQKLPRKCALALRLSPSSRIQGLNSEATASGHSSTIATLIQNTRPAQAGSRLGAVLVVLCVIVVIARVNGRSSPPVPLAAVRRPAEGSCLRAVHSRAGSRACRCVAA